MDGDKPIRYLGKFFSDDLKETTNKDNLKGKLTDLLKKTDETALTGPMKAWIYNFYIISKVSWELQVYEFPITYIRDLESIINRYLKKWFKLARCASPTVIYRNTDNYGLGLKKLETVYKMLKVGNAHHLKYNPDSNCAALYQAKMGKEREI